MLSLIYTYNVQLQGSTQVFPFLLTLTRTPPGPSTFPPTCTSSSTDYNTTSVMCARLQLIWGAALLCGRVCKNRFIAQRGCMEYYEKRVRFGSTLKMRTRYSWKDHRFFDLSQSVPQLRVIIDSSRQSKDLTKLMRVVSTRSEYSKTAWRTPSRFTEPIWTQAIHANVIAKSRKESFCRLSQKTSLVGTVLNKERRIWIRSSFKLEREPN